MKQKHTIRQITAFFMLLLFTIGITPKTYFHDVIANHKDVTYCQHPHKSSFCLHQKGFNCHFDTIVVTAPYLLQTQLFTLNTNTCYVDNKDTYRTGFTSSIILNKESRGPPVLIA